MRKTFVICYRGYPAHDLVPFKGGDNAPAYFFGKPVVNDFHPAGNGIKVDILENYRQPVVYGHVGNSGTH